MGERSRGKNRKGFIAAKCYSQPKKIICNERFMKQVLRLSGEVWKQRSRDEVISVSMFFHTENYWDQSFFHSYGQRHGPVEARHIFTEGQLTLVKISHAKWLFSPPPAIPGKWLKPVPAGRPAVSKDITGPTCGTGEQVSVWCGHTDATVFCSQSSPMKNELQTYCLCRDPTLSSHKGDSNVVVKPRTGLGPFPFGRSCLLLSSLQWNLTL